MYTSKFTSVNKNRTATAYTYAGYDMKGLDVLDYGCGRYYEISKEKALFYGARTWTGYDPFWKPQSLRYRSFDLIICANVLNVIENEREYKQAVTRVTELLSTSGKAIFQIYEGDRTGVGRCTKEDCWQRNETTMTHVEHINRIINKEEVKYTIKIYKNYITIYETIPF